MVVGCRFEEDEYEEDVYGLYEVFFILAFEVWSVMELFEFCMLELGLFFVFVNFI